MPKQKDVDTLKITIINRHLWEAHKQDNPIIAISCYCSIVTVSGRDQSNLYFLLLISTDSFQVCYSVIPAFYIPPLSARHLGLVVYHCVSVVCDFNRVCVFCLMVYFCMCVLATWTAKIKKPLLDVVQEVQFSLTLFCHLLII